MTHDTSTIHASAVLVGETAILIRGLSGVGKSRLAFDLILASQARQIPATRLIGDDRIHLENHRGALIARPAAALAGLIEIYGLGVRRCDYAAQGVVGLVVDLAAADAARLPEPQALQARIYDVTLPRLPVKTGDASLPLVLALLTTKPHRVATDDRPDCPHEMINHIGSTVATS